MADDRPREPTKRRQSITPPPHVLGWASEMAFLEEVGAELAIVFWRMLRKVRAWAETPPEERAGLFEIDRRAAQERLGYACVQAPELVEAFGTVAFLIRMPHMVQASHLAGACREVHAWAEERSLVRTAMLFAEAAAVADPDDPALANLAGRMCRRAACDERSASWFHRAFGLSVKARDRTEVIRGLLGYGALMKDLGEHEEARRYYERAARRAINTGRRRQAAEAHHDMLAIAAEVGTLREAERHVRRALELYPSYHPRLPLVAHDWALLLVRLHYYTPAIPLLKMAVRGTLTPELQILVWGTLARATAGARRQDDFSEIEEKLLHLFGLNEEYAAAALIHLAEGSRTFGRWDRAATFVERALSIARERKDALLARDAAALRDQISARELAPREEEPSDPDRIERLTLRIESRLRCWRAPGQGEPRADPNASRLLVRKVAQFPEPAV